MKTDNIILNKRGGLDNYFTLEYSRTDIKRKPLDFYLDLFNIEDYWIYKMTTKQKLISVDDMLKFNNAGYIFFNKEKYNKKHIEDWLINFLYKGGRSGIQYLNKPLPPFPPQKIIIKK